MRQLVALMSLLMVLIAGTAAGETYTLDDCIRMAMKTDPNLVRFRNAVKLADATVWQQVGGFLPSVGASYSQNQVNRGPLSPQYRYIQDLGQVVNVADSNSVINKGYAVGISARMTLFDGFSNVWNYLGSRASKRGAQYDFAAAQSDLTYLIKTDYYLVLKAKRDLDVAGEAVKRSEELLKLFQEKYDLGSASLSEVLKQKVQYGNDKLTLVQAGKNMETSFDNLALDVGLDPKTDFDVADVELKREPAENIDGLIEEALETHPSLLSSKAGVDAYRYDVRSAWGNYFPTLSLSYSYGWNKDRFNDIVKAGPFDHSGNINLSLSLNIFDGFSRERNLVRAKTGLNTARAGFAYERNRVIKDIQNAYLGIRVADETLSVTEETERAANEDFQLVQTKYNLGAAALWELLDAQVSLREAQFNKVKAEFDYNLALAKLQNATGK